MSTRTIPRGVINTPIVDKNGVLTSRNKRVQVGLTEGATNRKGLIPQYQHDGYGRVEKVEEDGKLIAQYEPSVPPKPGLTDVEASLRWVQLYLEKENRWLRLQSSHERQFFNEVTGQREYWLYGVRLSRDQWTAAKKMPVSEFVSSHYGLINPPGQIRHQHPDLERLADVGLPDS